MKLLSVVIITIELNNVNMSVSHKCKLLCTHYDGPVTEGGNNCLHITVNQRVK